MQVPGEDFLTTTTTIEDASIFDWNSTPLGNPAIWPESLKNAVNNHLAGQGYPLPLNPISPGIMQPVAVSETEKGEAINKIADAELRLRLATEAAQLGTFDWDLTNQSFKQSARLTEIFGFGNNTGVSHDDLLGVFHPGDKQVRNKAVQQSMAKGALEYEARVIWPDKTIHWVRVYGKVVFDGDAPSRMYGIVQDITKEKASITLLEESEDRLRIALEAAELATWDLHLNPISIFYSARLPEMFGYSEYKTFTHEELRQHIQPEDLPIVVNAHQQAVAGGLLEYEVRIIWQDGTIHWIRCNGKTLYNDRNEPVRMIGTLMDTTEERNTISALKESELLLKTISGTAPVGLWLTDVHGNCVFVNNTWEEWTGLSFEENMGMGWLSQVPKEDIPETQARFMDALINHGYFNAEFRLIKDGVTRWYLTEGYPFYGIDDVFMGFTGSVTDITDRKFLEVELERKVGERTEDLRRSEERHYKMIDEIQDYAILLLDKDGIIQNWNKGAEKIKGYKEEEILGKNFKIFYTPEDLENKVPERLVAITIKKGRAEAEGWRVKKDGTTFWASVVITALHDEYDNIIGFTKVTRDLTERKIIEEQRQLQAEELSRKNDELQRQKEFVDVILDSSIDIISVFDTSHRYITVNKSMEDAYKVRREYILGKTVLEAFPPHTTEIFRQNLARAFTGETIHGIFHTSIITGRHYESFFIPLKNDDEIYAVLAIAHDNTEIIESAKKLENTNYVLQEKTLDLQRVNSALEKSNSELEQYAYVASHDLQEPLRKIRTYAGILNEQLQARADNESVAILQKVINSAARMSNLIYDLLNFSRLLNPEKHLEKTDLNEIFENIINDFELTIAQKNAVIQIDKLPIIEAVPLQMNQLFYNLINNALKFSGLKKQPAITVTAEKINAKDYSHAELNINLAYVDISISDNGIGFSQQYAEQIFEVFKRLHTKQAYQGSGIGLALCRRIALNHQGDIFAVSKENNGAIFHVILPIQQS